MSKISPVSPLSDLKLEKGQETCAQKLKRWFCFLFEFQLSAKSEINLAIIWFST